MPFVADTSLLVFSLRKHHACFTFKKWFTPHRGQKRGRLGFGEFGGGGGGQDRMVHVPAYTLSLPDTHENERRAVLHPFASRY